MCRRRNSIARWGGERRKGGKGREGKRGEGRKKQERRHREEGREGRRREGKGGTIINIQSHMCQRSLLNRLNVKELQKSAVVIASTVSEVEVGLPEQLVFHVREREREGARKRGRGKEEKEVRGRSGVESKRGEREERTHWCKESHHCKNEACYL